MQETGEKAADQETWELANSHTSMTATERRTCVWYQEAG